jgi:hypothetical protein
VIPSAITFLVQCWRITRKFAEGVAMPNGGPDNCGTCGFNRRNRGIWRNPEPDETQTSFCEIRGIAVLADHWIYCQNWHTRTRNPIGPIYSSGIYEGRYRRIPWHGLIAPEFVQTGVCNECGVSIEDGISIAAVESAPFTFCCNLHYLQWWKRQHPDDEAPMSADLWEV